MSDMSTTQPLQCQTMASPPAQKPASEKQKQTNEKPTAQPDPKAKIAPAAKA